jgi:hypothetical protein
MVGYNIEIAIMFLAGIAIYLKLLPAEREKKIYGLPNRIALPVICGLVCASGEVVLSRVGLLVWAYRWWSWPNVYLIVVNYCAPLLFLTWVYDRVSIPAKRRIFRVLALSDIAGWLIFATWLKWI